MRYFLQTTALFILATSSCKTTTTSSTANTAATTKTAPINDSANTEPGQVEPGSLLDFEEWYYVCEPHGGPLASSQWTYKGKAHRSKIPKSNKLWCAKFGSANYYCDQVIQPYRAAGNEYWCTTDRAGDTAYTWGPSD